MVECTIAPGLNSLAILGAGMNPATLTNRYGVQGAITVPANGLRCAAVSCPQ